MKLILSACITALVTAACNNGEKETPAGGACRYEVKKLKATVIAVVKRDSIGSDILFRVTDGGRIYRDSASWMMQEHQWLADSVLYKNGIRTGKECDYEVHKLVYGSCNDHREFLTLNPYNPEGPASR